MCVYIAFRYFVTILERLYVQQTTNMMPFYTSQRTV